MVKRALAASAVSVALLLGSVAPAFAATTTSSPATNKKVVDLTCMVSAVDKRDTAIAAAWDTYAAAIKLALQTRKDALKAAWGISDRTQRRAAIKAAWDAYAKSRREARSAFNTARKNAWNQFYKDRKACRGQGEDYSTSGLDAAL